MIATDCWLCNGQHTYKTCPGRTNLEILQAKLEQYTTEGENSNIPAATLRARIKTLNGRISRLVAESDSEVEDEGPGPSTEPDRNPSPPLTLDNADIAQALLTVQKSVKQLQQELNRQRIEAERQQEAVRGNMNYLEAIERETLTEGMQQGTHPGPRTTATHLNLTSAQRRQVNEYVRDPLLHNPLPMTAEVSVDQPGEPSFSRVRYLRIVDFVDRTYTEQPRLAVHLTDGMMSVGEVSKKLSTITYEQWNIANNRILLQLVQRQHTPLSGYIKFTNHIHKMAITHAWPAVRAYDDEYRQQQAEENFPWGEIQLDLQTARLNASTLKANDRQPTTATRPICFSYNKGTCTRQTCRYRHVCTICEKTHPVNICSNARPAPSASSAGGRV
jgi:hypothetical protein